MIERHQLDDLLAAEGVDLQAARAALAGEDDSPLVVRLLAGAGAWFAAAFLIGFLALAGLLDNESTWVVFGLLLVAGATALRRHTVDRDEGDFLVQLSLAFALAGQALTIAGVGAQTDTLAGALLAGVVLELVLLFVFPDPLQRFLSTIGAVWMFAGFLNDGRDDIPLHLLAVPCLWGVDHVARTANPTGALRWERLRGPVVHGLAVAAFGLVLLAVVTEEVASGRTEHVFGMGWLTAIGCGAVYVAQVWRLAAGRVSDRSRLLLAAAATVLAGITWTTPAVVVGMSVVTVAWDRREPLLLSLSTTFLAIALFALYYDLDLTLLGKSMTLVASGALLLGVRRLLPTPPEGGG